MNTKKKAPASRATAKKQTRASSPKTSKLAAPISKSIKDRVIVTRPIRRGNVECDNCND